MDVTTDAAATEPTGPPPSGSLSDQIKHYKARLANNLAQITEAYWRNDDIDELVARHTSFHDALLLELWHRQLDSDARRALSLYAVGGYGRAELHPCSDIDLLILVSGRGRYDEQIASFIRMLWDIGLEVGHSVRTARECGREASGDLTIFTTLLERRRLSGSDRANSKLDAALKRRWLWPSAKFFRAKLDEQMERRERFDNVDYGLEPNVKQSPGGLRDLQTAQWVVLREFGTRDPTQIERFGLMTSIEREWLENGRRFLWWVRFGLHILAGREQDHLQFEYQRTLASRLGYVDSDAKLAVERFMQDYYRHIMSLREVNDILLQSFRESVVDGRKRSFAARINDDFVLQGDYLAFNPDVDIRAKPSLLLRIFSLLARRPDIRGVRAESIRAVRDNIDLIDDDFRDDPANAAVFMDLLRAPHELVGQLRRMRRYGVLGRYIPEFGDIIGQMQHDLFHIYTVDAHTMALIRNLRRFYLRKTQDEHPIAAHAIHAVPKVELLYIAGLFHDIGKGRGGDHSVLGAQFVLPFCRRHGLSHLDTELVAWLVREHLTMSSVAQRQDIHDPDVINEFARFVRSEMRLNYLYALTVADICATNPTLWNGFRASLMRTLYGATRRALRQGLESPLDRAETIDAIRERAREKLLERGVDAERVEHIWTIPSADFFLRHSISDVVDITEEVSRHSLASGPLVLVRNAGDRMDDDGLTEVFLFAKDAPAVFATSVIELDALELGVHSARIYTDEDGRCFNSYMVLPREADALSDADRDRVRREMTAVLGDTSSPPEVISRRVSRQLQQLYTPAEVSLATEEGAAMSTLTIHAADHPGVLALIGALLVELGVTVHEARITTLGERIEDIFEVTDDQGRPFADTELARKLSANIAERIDAELGGDDLDPQPNRVGAAE